MGLLHALEGMRSLKPYTLANNIILWLMSTARGSKRENIDLPPFTGIWLIWSSEVAIGWRAYSIKGFPHPS
jgi:hypothetical protein